MSASKLPAADRDTHSYLQASDIISDWMREYYRYLVDGDPSNGLHPKARAALTLRLAAALDEAAGRPAEKPKVK
jgi:hypothetical protein